MDSSAPFHRPTLPLQTLTRADKLQGYETDYHKVSVSEYRICFSQFLDFMGRNELERYVKRNQRWKVMTVAMETVPILRPNSSDLRDSITDFVIPRDAQSTTRQSAHRAYHPSPFNADKAASPR